MNKYRAKKRIVDDIKFDSIAESKYYEILKLRKLAGEIADFELQPSFELQPGFHKKSKVYRPIVYKADFVIIHHSGLQEIVDVKGMTTADFAMKRKMFEFQYQYLNLIVLAYDRKTDTFVDYDERRKEQFRAQKTKRKAKEALRAGEAQTND